MNKETIRRAFTVRVPVTRKEKITENGWSGHRSVPDGEVSADLLVEIDIEALVKDMGARAVRSKGGKCIDGYVKVTARDRQKVQS